LLQESFTDARKFLVDQFLLNQIPRLRNDRGAYWKIEIAEVQFKLFLALDRRLHVLELVTIPIRFAPWSKTEKDSLRAEDLLLGTTFRSTFNPAERKSHLKMC
jgi:hypothetical protein